MHIKYFKWNVSIYFKHIKLVELFFSLNCNTTFIFRGVSFYQRKPHKFISDLFSGDLFSSAAVYFQSPGLQRVSPSEAQMHGMAAGYSF